MLSNELEHCLNDAFRHAREARHELLTVEHLLLAMLGTPEVREILGTCRCDLATLQQDLKDHLERSTPRLAESSDTPVHPTHGFQRVLQRAVFHIQSSGKQEVGVANVLVAIFSEKQSDAVHLLNRQNVTRQDVVDHLSHKPNVRSTIRIGSVVIHTPEFDRTVAFWQAALKYVPRDRASADWIVLRDPTGKGPNLSFHGRDRRPRSRSWVHLDLYASDREAEVRRLLVLGARRYPWRYPPGSDFVVLEDPGGNLFCVVAKPDDH